VVYEQEAAVTDVLDVLERGRVEVVHADNAEPTFEEVLAEVRAEKAGPPGHDGGRHGVR
jgi:hypothetical protein